MNGEEEHIHLLIETGPEMCPLEFITVLKTKTSRSARKNYAEQLKKWYWKPYFWSDSYFITIVSEQSLSAVKEYIKNQ